MEEIDEGGLWICPRCGASEQSARCAVCGHCENDSLRLLPPLASLVQEQDANRRVRLVREYKGPTVKDLLAAPDEVIDRLPGQVKAMRRALSEGDLGGAERKLDAAFGSLLPGPGSEHLERRGWLWPALVWLWCALLLSILALLAFQIG